MPALVEIYRGAWVHPEQVVAIVVRDRHAEIYKGAGEIPPSVHVTTAPGGDVVGWEFKTWEDAKAFADKITAVVNAVVTPLTTP